MGLWDPQNRDLRRKPPPETKLHSPNLARMHQVAEGEGRVLVTQWRSRWPVTERWRQKKAQTVIAMRERGWHRRDMMVMSGAQCSHLLGKGGVSLAAVQLSSGCCILVVTEVRAHLVTGEGEVPVVIKGVARLIKHEIAGPAFSLSLTPMHSLRHRLVRSRQSASVVALGFLRF